MSTIVVDAATKAKILAAGGVAEVRDESGVLLGRFFAEEDPSQYDLSGITEEELRRRADAPGPTYTTAEVLEYVRKLA